MKESPGSDKINRERVTGRNGLDGVLPTGRDDTEPVTAIFEFVEEFWDAWKQYDFRYSLLVFSTSTFEQKGEKNDPPAETLPYELFEGEMFE
jgi:hypothetical protein